MTLEQDHRETVTSPEGPPKRGNDTAEVAVLYTSAPTVIPDIGRAMRIAGLAHWLPKENETVLKVNISWQHYYPACSTTPWQLEGVIRCLRDEGYRHLIAAHNGTVVVKSHEGEVRNKHKAVQDSYGIPSEHLTDPGARWVRYAPKGEISVLNDIFPDGIEIPEMLMGRNIVHLPTLKTHVFTTMTGAMKNAFGGLLHYRRHWTHAQIHETLVDLLTIQQEIHPGIFAVMDGTIAGDGPGPRAMRPHVKNLILASADQVAIDAVAAKLMGFDPMSIDFIRLAHERNLGCGDINRIQIAGIDIAGINFGFTRDEDTFASRGQKLIYWGPLKPLEKLLLRSPIVPWSYFASNAYYNAFWYPLIGRKRVAFARQTEWGQLFERY
jgi:uncharacterized protein (DUF362 family)